MLKHAFLFFLKLLFLYLTLGIYAASVILIEMDMPMMLFIAEPFMQISAVVIIAGAAVSLKYRSRTPFLWALFWVLFAAALLHIPYRYVSIFIGIFLFAGAINYLYRNRFTEPMLIFLPVIAGAVLLIRPIYINYLIGWIYFETGINSFKDSSVQEIMLRTLFQILFVLPVIFMYFLGKQGYVRFFPLMRRLRPGKTGHSPSVPPDRGAEG